ncbi:Fe-S cluster assembly transcriptional regulator IscR, partial [Colwellia ponticola]
MISIGLDIEPSPRCRCSSSPRPAMIRAPFLRVILTKVL